MSKKPRSNARKWVPVDAVVELPDGRTVPAIDDGMFLKPIGSPTNTKQLSSTEEARSAVGDVFSRVYKSIDDIEKEVRRRRVQEPEEFSKAMTREAAELLALIASAKRLIHEKEWELAAPYLLSTGQRWQSLRIELEYRRAIISKRGSESGPAKLKGISNHDLLEFLGECPDGLSMRPSEAERFMRAKYGKGHGDLTPWGNRAKAFQEAFRRAKKKPR